MKKLPLLFSIILLTLPVLSQQARIREAYISLPTYSYSSPDPVPQPGRIYPYYRFDGYSAEPANKKWKMIILENEFIEVFITPEIGGKIWGAIEKSTGNEFIYFNHSVKFRDIAMRGPWTSGGIEINFGIIGHAPTCSSPVDYYMHEYDDGSVSCFLGALDLPSRTEWRVEVNLQPDRSYFTTHAIWINPTSTEHAYYHWMNGAVKAKGNLEFSYPGKAYIGHDGVSSSWPKGPEDRQISFYEKNNFGSYKSYHVLGEYTNFFGGYWHDDQFGFGRYSNYDDKPGKKIWIWGLSRQGMIWEDLLTDTDGQYVEIQSGRLFNQEASASTYTPFKHRGFHPYSVDTWSEYWFPVMNTNGIDRALPKASVNIEYFNDSLHTWICSNTYLRDTVTILSGSDRMFSKWEVLKPTEVAHYSMPIQGEIDKISVKIGNQFLIGPGGTSNQALSRPLEASDFKWNTVYGLYILGKEKYRQREYSEAENLFLECLDKNPGFQPALNGLAQVKLNQLEPEKAWELLRKALSIDTYDPETNFYYGVASMKTGRITDAKDGFSIAASSVTFRCGSYTELAKIYFREGDMEKALEYSQKSMMSNRLNLPGLEIMALSYKNLGLLDDARATLVNLLNIDPLNHFGRFELDLVEGKDSASKNLASIIKNELPHETYLETALKYYRLDCFNEAILILDSAPEYPVIKYWSAYLHFLSGRETEAKHLIKEADQLSTHLVFPHREESVEVLKWVDFHSNSWKSKYFLALIYWNEGHNKIAESYLNDCYNEPDDPVFYLAKGDLYSATNPIIAQKSYLKAIELDPNSWKSGYKTIQFHIKTEKFDDAIILSEKYFTLHPRNYYLGLQYADLLNDNGDFEKCIDLLQNLKVLPNEGATSGRVVWRESNLRMAAKTLLEKDFELAKQHVDLALEWPENLGVGRPYDVDERVEDFLSVLVSRQLGEETKIVEAKKRIVDYPSSDSVTVEEFISAWILRSMDRKKEGDRIMKKFERAENSDLTAQWCLSIYNGDQALAEKILKDSDNREKSKADFALDLLVQLNEKTKFFNK